MTEYPYFHKVVLSCNENPDYYESIPIVARAYNLLFPSVEVHVAFLTNRSEDDEMVINLKKYATVTLYPIHENWPEFGQAKIIRFLLAAEQGDLVSYIDDADLLPLNREFITDKTVQRPSGVLLCVGGEVYDEGHLTTGTYPVSQMTAEGWLWKKLFNPKGLSYRDLLYSWSGQHTFDFRENIAIVTDYENDRYFSDERLIKRLLRETPVPKLELARGYKDFMEATVDRFRWEINMDKLYKHGYVNAHLVRPYSKHKERIDPLVKYLEDTFA